MKKMSYSRSAVFALALASALLLVLAKSPREARASIPPVSEVSFPNGERLIRVRIAEAVPVARISGHALRLREGSPRTRGLASDSETWELRCHDDRVQAVRVEGGAGVTLDLRSPARLRSEAGFLKLSGKPYRDFIQVHAAGSLCEVINEVSIEKYLSGLVNAEFSSRWSEEAIAAQVVAARTYALYQMAESRKQALHFDVDASVSDQVYDGSIREDARSERIVQKTRGIALTVGSAASPSPIKAFYHSTCAGRTELPQNVWGKAYPGYRHGVACPFCAQSPALNWSLEFQPEELSRLIRQGARGEGIFPAPLQASAELLSLQVARVSPEGRVAEVLSRWRDGKGLTREWAFSGVRLRDWIGPARFRSTAFTVSQSGGFRFDGKGNGHGVGLCQYGAKRMGETGYTMSAILRHYYPDAVLRRLW